MARENNHFSDEVIVTNILNGKIQDFTIVVKNTEKLVALIATINYLQKKKIPIMGMAKTFEDAAVASENPESETIKTEAVEILNTAIAKLPPLYQTLITLYHLEELSNKEISEITSLPEGTIKSYLYRARKILKDSISIHYKNEPS